MEDQVKKTNKWVLWLGWILACLLGFSIGAGLCSILLSLVSETAASLILGILVGVAQWLILRRVLPGLTLWIPINLLGIPLGFSLANAMYRIAPIESAPILTGVLFYSLIGLISGIVQWIMLCRHLHRAGLWLLFSILGWSLGGLLKWVNPIASPFFLRIMIDYAMAGILIGLFTGVGLAFLKKKPADDGAGKPDAAMIVSLLCCTVLLAVICLYENWPQKQLAAPDFGEKPTCSNLPPLECTVSEAYCGELVAFEPVSGPGYSKVPVNGETWENLYRSYLRRDVMMAVQYAAARVMCETENWEYQSFRPIGFGDMSEADGSLPGTSIGSPGHPAGTHEGGKDLDIAYYQTVKPITSFLETLWGDDEEGNQLKSVCKHTWFGRDVYHCVEPPRILDPWRTVLFHVYLAEHPNLRVIGFDGQVGLVLVEALDQLVQAGWVDPGLSQNIPGVFEVEDEGYGFFLFHHHHMHVSFQVEP